jgi:hypothetical protein
VVVLFLYHRLYLTAQKQLDSLKQLNFPSLERLTGEREDVTRRLCESIRNLGTDDNCEPISEPIRKKIHELTTQTLNIDAEIKERLLEELKERTLELSEMSPQNME